MRNNSKGIDFTKPIQNTATVNGFDEFFGIAASLDMPPYVFIRNDRVTEQPTSSLKGEDKGVIEAKIKSLGEASVGIAQKAFEEAQNKAKESQGNDNTSEEESVVDAEYEEVNEEVNEEDKTEDNKS